MISRIRGTEDILPSESGKWQYIEETARKVLERYHFSEIRTPIFESFNLFSRSVGETTDIVSKEMYDFYDKGERHIALRPEGTASVVRAYVEHRLYGPEYPHPMKMYYMGPMFRYERPQAGRQRQFHQLGVEVLGSTNPASDVETIVLALDIFKELGVGKLKLHLNSLGDSECRKKYRQALVDYFTPYKDQLSDDSKKRLQDNPLRIIDSKAPEDIELKKDAPSILDFLSKESQKHFESVKSMLDQLGIDYTVDPTIVRGLDYYQDTIFEIIVEDESIGAQSTVCGGGRYDGLVEELGGPETPGIGFAIGVERLLLLLEEQNIEIPSAKPVDIYVMGLGDEVNELSQVIVQKARQAGLIAERDYLGRSIRSQFKTVDKINAQLVITLGSRELEEGVVQVKEQRTGQQNTVSIDELLNDVNAVFEKYTKI